MTDEFSLPKEEFMWALLNEYGIKTWNHYSPMHLATSFRSRGLGKVGDCPVAEALFEQYVSLPIHPRLTNDAVAYMIESVRQLASRPHVAREITAPLLSKLLVLYDPELALAQNPNPNPNPGHNHSHSDSLHGDQLAAAARPVSGAGGEEDCDSVVGAQWEAFSALVAEAFSAEAATTTAEEMELKAEAEKKAEIERERAISSCLGYLCVCPDPPADST